MAKKCAMCGKELISGLTVHSECVDYQLLSIKSRIIMRIDVLKDDMDKIYSCFPNGIKYSETKGQIKAYEKVLKMIDDEVKNRI